MRQIIVFKFVKHHQSRNIPNQEIIISWSHHKQGQKWSKMEKKSTNWKHLSSTSFSGLFTFLSRSRNEIVNTYFLLTISIHYPAGLEAARTPRDLLGSFMVSGTRHVRNSGMYGSGQRWKRKAQIGNICLQLHSQGFLLSSLALGTRLLTRTFSLQYQYIIQLDWRQLARHVTY